MAVSGSPTATWDTIQDVFYRREEVYQMGWNVGDLSDYLICAGRNAGPIAMIRDERKVMLLGKHTPGKPKSYVFSAAGQLLSTLSWDLSPPILMHLTLNHLFVLSDEGVYRLYDLSSPQTYTQHTLGAEVSEVGLVSARAHDDGFVVLTGHLQFLEVRGWAGGRSAPLADAGLTEAPASWTLIPPEQSSSGHVELLISLGSTVITLDALDRIDQRISRGPFSHILPSPNGRFLALLTIAGSLWVVSSDFSRNLSDIPLSSLPGVSGIPDQVAWCGDNAIALSFANTVVIAGPGGDSLTYDLSSPAHIYTEIDGLRILSSGASSFVQKVPESSLAVFAPGSSHPAAILYDALEHFERKSAKADEAVRSIKADLATAVDTCVEAAGRERDAAWQRRLLRTAQFGRAFMNLYNPSDFIGMAQTLKVLNAVRYYEVGIPLTYDQYLQIGPSALISMLLSRNAHLVALRISQHLSLRPDAVLRHWASAKIARSKGIDPGERGAADDEALCAAIVDKYKREGERASFADIAKGAWAAGRVRLATMLLDHERRAEEQVPLLLEMKQDRIALLKAIHSGDTDMVHHVLLHLRHTLPPGDFFHLLDDANDPQVAPALALLQVYAKQADRQLLRDFYYQDDRRVETACLEWMEAGETGSVEERLKGLKGAAKAFGEDKERSFEAKMSEDAHRLLQLQSTYEAELEHKFHFVGLSVDDFVTVLIREGFSKRAERVRVDWKIPDRRWYWVKLKALARAKDWEGLEGFARAKKSPIGYEPFVTHLLSLDPPAPKQAASFVHRCDAKLRADLYARCGDWSRAAEAAAERKDRAKLDALLRAAPDGMAQRDIEEVIKRLK